jgi:chromosome segregation ATPase
MWRDTVSTLVERLDDIWITHDLSVEVLNAIAEARATITRLEGEAVAYQNTIDGLEFLNKRLEGERERQDAQFIEVRGSLLDTIESVIDDREKAKARAEAAEATLAEATSATMMAEMRADKLMAENARLREALIKIAAVRPEIATHVPEGFAPVFSCQQIAKAALSGDLTNG